MAAPRTYAVNKLSSVLEPVVHAELPTREGIIAFLGRLMAPSQASESHKKPLDTLFDGLLPLPTHIGDMKQTKLRSFAAICSIQGINIGSLNWTSPVQVCLHPSFVAPTLEVIVRCGHDTNPAPSMQKKATKETKVSILIDLDELQAFDMSKVPAEDVSNYKSKAYGRIALRTGAGGQMHRHQTRQFPNGSGEQQVVDALRRSGQEITLNVSFDTPVGIENAWDEYYDMAIDARGRRGSVSTPTNDWWMTRHTLFDYGSPNPWQRLMDATITMLPWPEWLIKVDAITGEEYVLDYFNAGTQTAFIPFTVYPSAETYTRITMMALLWQKRFQKEVMDMLFNVDVTYPTRLEKLDDRLVLAHIRLANPSLTTTERVVPHEGQEIWAYPSVPKLHTKPLDRSTHLKGNVAPQVRKGYDFAVMFEVPEALLKQHFWLKVGGDEEIPLVVLPDRDIKDVAVKMNAISRDVVSALQRPPQVLPSSNGRPRSLFCPSSLILEPRIQYFSPDLLNPYPAAAQASARAILNHADINEEQENFLKNALTGIVGGVIVLEGLPGTGKTYVVALFSAILTSLGHKVLLTAQSNAGVKAFIKSFKDSLSNNGDDGNCFVQLENATAMTRNLEGLFSDLPTLSENVPQNCLARRIWNFVTDERNQQIATVIQFKEYVEIFRRGGKRANFRQSTEGYHAVFATLCQLVLQDVQVVACTTFVAATNQHVRAFKANVVVLDEASQTTDPDSLAAIVPQDQAGLLVLSGDVQQLGPVVTSSRTINNRNPFGSVLECSTMARLLKRADTPRVRLVRNYRSHPDILKLPSSSWYNNELVSGRGPKFWDTPLATKVATLLQERLTQYKGSRQLFFNVEGSVSKYTVNSPSWTNRNGAYAVVKLTRMLVCEAGVDPKEIGIITMYRDDLALLDDLLINADLQTVDVQAEDEASVLELATVAAFQGREKRIIIVHFVATGENGFGHVNKSNRLCVATTRAQEFQFLVGNLSAWKKSRWLSKCRQIESLMAKVEAKGQVVAWKEVK